MMNEKRAIELCLRHRDPLGFEFLVRKYQREAFYHAYGFVKDREEALDLLQEAFSRAFNAIVRLERLERFYPWFYRILKNLSLNLLSRKKTADGNREELHGFQKGLNGNRTPESLLMAEENAMTIRSALNRLNPEFREILLLKYTESRCYADIADILSIPRGTVMSRLYNARMAFKDAILCLREEKK